MIPAPIPFPAPPFRAIGAPPCDGAEDGGFGFDDALSDVELLARQVPEDAELAAVDCPLIVVAAPAAPSPAGEGGDGPVAQEEAAESPPAPPPSAEPDAGEAPAAAAPSGLRWAEPATPAPPPAAVRAPRRAPRQGGSHLSGQVTLRPPRLAPPIAASPPDGAAVAIPMLAPLPESPAPAKAQVPAASRAFQSLLGSLGQTRHDGVDISLSDTVLGPIRFAIATEGNSVVITVTADLAATRALLQEHAQDLLGALRQAGFQTAILNWGRAGGAPRALPPDDAEAETPLADADAGPLDLVL